MRPEGELWIQDCSDRDWILCTMADGGVVWVPSI
jgi:hypothetical protein